MNANLPSIVWIQDSVLPASSAVFRSERSVFSRHESVVYWAGRHHDHDWIITTCIIPKAHTRRGAFWTTAAANAEVVSKVNEMHLELFAQVHSHPGSLVDHSNGDTKGALMPYEGFLSLVVPNYGKRDLWPLTRCGVHRFERGGFRRLSDTEVRATFRLLRSSVDLR